MRNGDSTRDVVSFSETRRGRALPGSVPPTEDEAIIVNRPGPNSIFWHYLRVVRKHKGAIAVVSLAGALIGLAVQLPRVPLYRATVAVEVQAVNEEFLYSKDITPNTSNGGMYPEIDMATQTKILGTRLLLDRVTAKLKADPTLQVTVPEDRFAAWRKALHLPARPGSGRDDLIADVASTVKVPASRNTRIIEISCDSPDPKLAAAFANTMASEYIDQTLETRWQSAKHTGEWLGRQLDDMKVQLERSEEQLQSYAAAMSLMVTGDKDKSNVSEDKLRQLQTELSSAQADRVAKQARYELASSSRADDLGQVQDDPTLRSFDVKLADLRRELAELSTTLTPEHYKVKKVEAQIAEMETDRKKARDRIVERIYGELKEAEQREKLLAASYETQSALVSNEAGKLVHYNLLQREVDTNRQLYETLLQKVKEAGISAALRASNIRVVDPAQAPSAPFAPDLPQGAFIGLLLGVFSGLALAVFQENVRRNIEVPGDATFCLNVPLLGSVPSRSLDRAAALRRAILPPASGAGSRGSLLADFHGNTSITAESFRTLLTSILFAGRRQPAQVILVSSPCTSEGKTTVTCNLAMAYAEALRRVLVIDCDMRRPRVHEVFGTRNDMGLADLLTEREPLDHRSLFLRAQTAANADVTFLPSGKPQEGTANLLHSRRFSELIALAREQFDVILIDTPPMLQLADARIVGSVADGAILVIRAGQTSRDAALAARQQFDEDGIKILGVVLNDWDPKAIGYYGYEYYENTYYANPPASGAAPSA
jgi:capsular exopolysaccharide synthesis family protein